MSSYVALIHKEPDTDYGVSFPDFPGCVSAGATLDEARSMAVEALALHIEGMLEDGEPIPAPSSFEAVMAEREARDAVAVLIPAPATAKTLRVNVTLRSDLLERADRYAEDHGLTRSGLVARGLERVLEDA